MTPPARSKSPRHSGPPRCSRCPHRSAGSTRAVRSTRAPSPPPTGLPNTGAVIHNFFVIITGLPAGGKSTLARGPAAELNLPVIGKDVTLERLVAGNGLTLSDCTRSGRERWTSDADASYRDEPLRPLVRYSTGTPAALPTAPSAGRAPSAPSAVRNAGQTPDGSSTTTPCPPRTASPNCCWSTTTPSRSRSAPRRSSYPGRWPGSSANSPRPVEVEPRSEPPRTSPDCSRQPPRTPPRR